MFILISILLEYLTNISNNALLHVNNIKTEKPALMQLQAVATACPSLRIHYCSYGSSAVAQSN
jgi:hypothetical protein